MTKITATKIKRELIKNYGWDEDYLRVNGHRYQLIKDTLSVVDDILMYQKRISIK